jgi:hypothetical protein
MTQTAPQAGLTYRIAVLARSLAAIAGGFAIAAAMGWLIAALLTATGLQARAPAVHTGTLLSWLIWSCAAMWAFHARTVTLAWAWLIGPAIVAALTATLVTG